MRDLMTKASAVVTGGLPIRTEAKVIRWPDRYMSEGGRPMWNRIMGLLDKHGA